MKLVKKISNYFFFNAVLIFLIISSGMYFIIEYSITDETDEQLLNISKKTIRLIKSGNATSFPPFVEISTVDQTNGKGEFKNIKIAAITGQEEEPFRQLTTFIKVRETNYKIISRISLIEKDELLLTVSIATITIIFSFLLMLFFLNKTISQKILKDFFETLKKLETFSIKSNERLLLNNSSIEEFEQLNRSLLFLSEKAKSEYRSLKDFTEELNHEIQTPVAIVKSKLELMLQNRDLSEASLSVLDTSLKNLSKLERINKSILLLNKLEHKDLFENSEIKLSEEINNVTASYSDFIEAKNLSVDFSLHEEISIQINQSLINILLSNLLSNAIKHNIRSGVIIIDLIDNKLIISNNGHTPKVNTNKYFERFYKESKSADSVGLGLTIVKKICALYNLDIKIEYTEGVFITTVTFNNSGTI